MVFVCHEKQFLEGVPGVDPRKQRAWEIWWTSHKTNAVIDIWNWNNRWDGKKQSVRYYIQDQYAFLSF